jgi:hypothetical protein
MSHQHLASGHQFLKIDGFWVLGGSQNAHETGNNKNKYLLILPVKYARIKQLLMLFLFAVLAIEKEPVFFYLLDVYCLRNTYFTNLALFLTGFGSWGKGREGSRM